MSDLSPDYFNRPLEEVDPEIAEALRGELERQQGTLEMIASENFVPRAVLECQGSVLTNKYAEGYPGRRYYGGCEWVDVSEQLAIDRAKALFGAEHANVQPHSGSQANAAVYHALLEPGRHDHGAVAGPRRTPHPRHAPERLRAPVQRGRLRGRPRQQPDRHGRGRPHRPRGAAEAAAGGLVGVSPPARLRALPGDRRRGRRPADGRHGPLRRPRRRRAAPQPGRARRRRHHDHPQDPRRPPRGDHPVPARSTPRRSTRRSSPASREARWST